MDRFKKYRETHRDELKPKRKVWKRNLLNRNLAFLNKRKNNSKCLFCEEKELCCLDFHHTGEKEMNVSDLVRGQYSLIRLEEEMKKCVIVCSNCHRKIHAGLLTV